MRSFASSPPVFRFGPFEFRPEQGELRKSGTLIKLQPQPARLLHLLLSNPGEIVRREQIQQAVWGSETAVDFDLGVNRCVRQIRSALLDDAESPRYIRTIPRQGYCFIGPLEQEVTPPKEEVSSAPEVSQPPETRELSVLAEKRTRWREWLTGASALILIGIAVFLLVRPAPKENHEPVSQIRSLAVMPMQNMSNDPSQEYFADGMTEALITKLAQDTSLRVISRTSVMHYKNASRTLPEIARELDVDGVIEGSVLRSGNKIRIIVQLLNAPRDQHLWASSFESNDQDIIRLQEDVSRQIAAQINNALAGETRRPARKQSPVSPKAYEAYLKGRYFWNQGTLDSVKRSLTSFEQAIQQQPDYALAYSGLADAYVKLGKFGFLSQRDSYDRGMNAALKSLSLDRALPQPHMILGQLKAGEDWDWADAEKEYRQAIQLEANDANGHYLLSSLLSILKRHDEAIAEVQKAVQLDPLSLPVSLQYGISHYLAGRFNEAADAFHKTLELNDASISGHVWLGLTDLHRKRGQAASAALQQAVEISRLSPDKNQSWFLPRLAEIYALTGRQREAEALLGELQRLPEREQSAPLFALVCIALGRQEEAFQWLAKGFQNRDMDMTLLAVEPGYNPVRSEPQFRNFLQKMKLPE